MKHAWKDPAYEPGAHARDPGTEFLAFCRPPRGQAQNPGGWERTSFEWDWRPSPTELRAGAAADFGR
jgi:hypothetical protein